MREILPTRRASENIELHHEMFDGSMQKLQVTYGFNLQGKVSEVFCGSFKAGSDMNALVGDVCVSISLHLQHGYSAKQLLERLSTPHSIYGTLVKGGADLEE